MKRYIQGNEKIYSRKLKDMFQGMPTTGSNP